ncbi:MAG: biotin carboxyl carrier protein [Deltaproteobacteria bacterium]|nr:biotin carboxyl carrier protein [Deltaproteobacteria bacterium]
MAKIYFVDTTLRDGNQSLWDGTGLSTSRILSLASQMDRAGFKACDFIASTHMGVAVKYHKENPWERIQLVSKAMPNTPLSFGTTGRRFVGFKRAPDSILNLVMERMAANGIRRLWIVDAAHEIEIFKKNARMAKAAGIQEVVAALCYTVSPIHTDDFYARMTQEFVSCADVDTVYLKDQGGLLTPDRIRTLVPAIQANLNGHPLEIHSHCSIGLAPMVYVEAVQLGIEIVHTAIPPLANGTSQPSVFNVEKNLNHLGFENTLNMAVLEDLSRRLKDIAVQQGRPEGVPAEYDLSYFDHQIPGGMMTTLKRQLSEAGMAHRLPEVMTEIIEVRRELGYPIMVTPLSQFVGTQAAMNVMSGKRYKLVSDGIIEYVVGYFGKSPAPINPDILDKIHGLKKTKEMLKKPFPQPSISEIRKGLNLGAGISDDEFLLRFALTGNEVDVMLAAVGKTERLAE